LATIDVLDRTGEDQALATLTLAFIADPIVRWAFPEPRQYLTYYPASLREFAIRACEHQSGYAVDGFGGVAIWLPPGVDVDEEAASAVFHQAVREQDKEAVFGLLERTGAYRPGEPHWYLAVIGVDPARQGKGHGSALMAHALAACDAQHMPAYLESSNERNLPLYERHGFRIMDRLQVEGSPPIWPMLREARVAGSG
jgi:ribosomal protein S18 acetylase RimI-like enzyme